ncbi:MAG: DotA/TraY family protein [Alphaproteobacteria bacterium]
MNGVQVKKIAGYMFLPGIIPRSKKLFASGFGYIAFLIATIFNIVRLLPADHPYLSPANIGRFGIRHVVAQAADNLVLSRKNIDQLIIFTLILAGIVIMALQIALAVYGYVFKPALAASMFITEFPNKDIAYILLDEVFGLPGLFDSCVFAGTPCRPGVISTGEPWAFHYALQSMLQFYSLGLLFIGVLIFFYFLLVIVVETAASGHPFGQRFQNVWVPIRLVVALGLLIPVSSGLNSAQYVVLYAAKFGSSFATNTWLEYNEVVKNGTSGQAVFPGGANANPIGERESLLALPQTPSTAPVTQAMALVHACAYAYWKTNAEKTSPPPPENYTIKPYLVKNAAPGGPSTPTWLDFMETDYEQALDFYNNGDIVLVFGEQKFKNPLYDAHPGNVIPLCGAIRIPINYLKNRGEGDVVGGADALQQFWYDMIGVMWRDFDLSNLSAYFVESKLDREDPLECGALFDDLAYRPATKEMDADGEHCKVSTLPVANRQAIVNNYNVSFKTAVKSAWNTYNQQGTDIRITDEILKRGWAGAGMWYNIIADINGGFVGAAFNMPLFTKYPIIMEQVLSEKQKTDAEVEPDKQFDCKTAKGLIQLKDPADKKEAYAVACVLSEYIAWWNVGGTDQAKADATPIGNFILDVMNMLFGTEGLMGIRSENALIHPLAQLTALGKGLVESAILYVGVSVISAAGGGMLTAMGKQQVGALLNLASDIAVSLAFIGLTAGFILYYVLPFLPFLYFFFAVGTWIKGIFEAMVGAPLWALAHLRLDGEGLPGDAASNGYFLIFDISLRPVLSVMALIGSMLILTAQVRVLNLIWDLVVDNLTGFSGEDMSEGTARGIIDSYFFTVLYAIMVYMLATASFKLIDAIPDNVLRYLGANTSSFSGINPDATEGLTRYAAIGGITFGQQLTGSVKSLAQGIGGSVGSLLGPPARTTKP